MVCMDRSTFRFRFGVAHCRRMGHLAGIGRRPKVYDAAMRQGALAVVVASCVLLAACDGSSSDGDTSTTTSATSAPTSVATTTEPPALSTDAPTTTIDSEAQLAAAEQAYLDAFDAYIAAARDPSDPALRAESNASTPARTSSSPSANSTDLSNRTGPRVLLKNHPGRSSCSRHSSCPTAPMSSNSSCAPSTPSVSSRSEEPQMGRMRS